MTDIPVADPVALIDRQTMLANFLMRGWPNLSIPGIPRVSAAAAVGNATQENQCRSVTTGAKDHGSDGLFQWRLDRLTKMQGFGDSNFTTWKAIEPQAAFFAYECATDYPNLWADLVAGTKSLATLTANICDVFERPSADGRVLDQRIGYAQAFLNTSVPVSPPVIPTPVSPPDELATLAQILADIAQFPPTARARMTAYLVSRIDNP